MEVADREVFQRGGEGGVDNKTRYPRGRFDSFRRRSMAKRVRNPGQNPVVLRGRFESAGQADDSGGPVQFSVGDRISAARFRSRAESLVFEPSSVHGAGGRGHPAAQDGSEESA